MVKCLLNNQSTGCAKLSIFFLYADATYDEDDILGNTFLSTVVSREKKIIVFILEVSSWKLLQTREPQN